MKNNRRSREEPNQQNRWWTSSIKERSRGQWTLLPRAKRTWPTCSVPAETEPLGALSFGQIHSQHILPALYQPKLSLLVRCRLVRYIANIYYLLCTSRNWASWCAVVWSDIWFTYMYITCSVPAETEPLGALSFGQIHGQHTCTLPALYQPKLSLLVRCRLVRYMANIHVHYLLCTSRNWASWCAAAWSDTWPT